MYMISGLDSESDEGDFGGGCETVGLVSEIIEGLLILFVQESYCSSDISLLDSENQAKIKIC